jgi:hypothetical protein
MLRGGSTASMPIIIIALLLLSLTSIKSVHSFPDPVHVDIGRLLAPSTNDDIAVNSNQTIANELGGGLNELYGNYSSLFKENHNDTFTDVVSFEGLDDISMFASVIVAKEGSVFVGMSGYSKMVFQRPDIKILLTVFSLIIFL